MVYKKLKKEFDLATLRQIKDEENSCIVLERKDFHLTVHPFQVKDFASSIKEILSTKFARYDRKLGGILLGYENVALKSGNGFINYDNSFMHVNVEADFYIFKPESGKLLKGIVNKKSKSHIGCLVHQLFNVSLPSPDEDEKWLGDSVALGQEILFRIICTNLNRKLPYIQGEIISVLVDSDSGISTGEENAQNVPSRNIENDAVHHKKKKKHKSKEHKADISGSNTLDQSEAGFEQEVSPKKSKRHKKHKSLDQGECSYFDIDQEITFEAQMEHQENVNLEAISPSKRKRKRHSGQGEESFSGAENQVELTNVAENLKSSKKRKRDSVETETVDINPKKKKRKRSDVS